jgi:hypothetical protein
MLVRAIRRTWAAVAQPGVETIFYFGGRRARRRGAELELQVADDFDHIGEKTLECFAYVLEHCAFDVAFRTNCSSYVDLPNLAAFVEAQAAGERYYAGQVSEHLGIPFASGSGYFLSRDLMELVVAERAQWDHAQLDDVALGAILDAHGIRPTHAPRVTYVEPPAVEDVDTTEFHFRCKTASRLRLDDVEIMLRVDAAFARARGVRARRPPVSWRLARAARASIRAARR